MTAPSPCSASLALTLESREATGGASSFWTIVSVESSSGDIGGSALHRPPPRSLTAVDFLLFPQLFITSISPASRAPKRSMRGRGRARRHWLTEIQPHGIEVQRIAFERAQRL